MSESPSSFIDQLAHADANGLRVVLGHLDGLDDEGRLLFRAMGSDESVPVTIGLELSDGALVKAARLSRRALALIPPDASQPILVGLLRERVSAEARDASPGQLEVRMDGESLRFEAEKTIELRCGKARLVLHRDGRVLLKGAHIVSASSGSHRIKGATIALN